MQSVLMRLSICLCFFLFMSGCGFGAKQTPEGGTIMVIGQIEDLRAYSRVDFKGFKSDIGRNLPEPVLRSINDAVADRLRKTEFNQSSGKTLVVKGDIIHFETTPNRYAVARVALIDPERAETVGLANVTGRATAEAVTVPDEVAAGIANGVDDLLRQRMVP